MSNRWKVIRENVAAAIQALPAVDGTPVYQLGIPADILHMGARQAVGVCLTEDKWDRAARGIADYLDNPAEITIPVVIMSTSEYPPDSALTADGKIDDLTAAILGANLGDVGQGIRVVNVGDETTGPVYLTAEKSEIVAEPKRAEGSGGALLKVITFVSTVLPL